MNKHNLHSSLLILVFFCCSFWTSGQMLELKGKVIDAKTQKSVEFANLGVKETYIGTATDFNGEFIISIPNSQLDKTIRISAVGYSPKEILAEELKNMQPCIIKLFPQAYDLGSVEVTAKSKKLYGILKTSSNMITDNYIGSYEGLAYYKQITQNNTTECAIHYSDSTGYTSRDFSTSNASRRFECKEVRRNYAIAGLKDGIISAEELFNFDVVRVRANVLDVETMDEFDLSLAEKTSYNSDSVWVINYSLKNPSFETTGDKRIKSYKGTIYINMSDYAILRNELHAESSAFFHGGKTSSTGSCCTTNSNYSYSAISDYKKHNGKYALYKISYTGEYQNNTKSTVKESSLWIMYDYNDFNKKNSVNQKYFVSKDSDQTFWKRFSIPE